LSITVERKEGSGAGVWNKKMWIETIEVAGFLFETCRLG
jgi:hypothetical protein